MNESYVFLGELVGDLARETNGLLIPPGRRMQFSVACFSIVRDHHCAVALLLQHRLYASAYALLRPLYEAAVKGIWMARCATDEDIARHERGKELPPISELLDNVLASPLPKHLSNSLHRLKTRYWKFFSSLTHAGFFQVKQWLSSSGVEPMYTDEQIDEFVGFTAFMAILAALEMAHIANNESAISNIAAFLDIDAADSK